LIGLGIFIVAVVGFAVYCWRYESDYGDITYKVLDEGDLQAGKAFEARKGLIYISADGKREGENPSTVLLYLNHLRYIKREQTKLDREFRMNRLKNQKIHGRRV